MDSDDDTAVPLNTERPWRRRWRDNLGPVAPTDSGEWVPLNRGRWDDEDRDPEA